MQYYSDIWHIVVECLLMGKEVVTVGGGTGSPELNRALLQTNKVDFIRAIAAVFDSGGATGRRRLNSEGNEPAYSDAMRILLSLVRVNSEDDQIRFQALKDVMSHRNRKDEVLGHSVFEHFYDKHDGYKNIENLLKRLGYNLHGTVLPSTTQSANLIFTTESGRKFEGEHELDARYMSPDVVVDMVLDPQVNAYPEATKAIRQAKLIFLSFGSLHGSLLCNFLPDGMRQAMAESEAKIVLTTNLVSTRNETHDFNPLQYIQTVRRYTGVDVSAIVVPEISRREFESRYPEVASLYSLEYSHFLGWEQTELYRVQSESVRVITHQAIRIIDIPRENTKIVRHDPVKLAEALKDVL